MKKLILQNLKGEKTEKVPFWFMRQAGRYLPEYRDLRQKSGGFLNMVYDPEIASEITLQPIRRFGMDAAILFSDILVVPQALGQELKFESGEGPKLNPIRSSNSIKKLNPENIDETLSPIYETIESVCKKLTQENFEETTLIGFAGSPWTVACYMVEGGSSRNFEIIKQWAYGSPDEFQKLIDIISVATIHYLLRQIKAGAEAIQLFDSWAGVLDETNFQRWVIDPTTKIIQGIKKEYPGTPIIGFPRQVGTQTIEYIEKTGIQAVGLDYTAPCNWILENIPSGITIQGNMDPLYLLSGNMAMEKTVLDILEKFSDRPFIFNLGHGVIKETPVKHVEKLCQIIREFCR